MALADGEVILNMAAVREYMRTPDGPVMRRLMVVGDAVKVRTVASLKSGFPQDFLGPTIVKRTVMTADGPAVEVGSSKTKTDAHPIAGNPILAFKWPKQGGGMFFFRSVNHPGSNFDKYLSSKLKAALAEISGASI